MLNGQTLNTGLLWHVINLNMDVIQDVNYFQV